MAQAPVRRDDRLGPVKPDDRRDGRSPGRRDRDRILYSAAFRRLSGVTQVVSPTERYLVHNRLTHTLKVAQIGRSLAEMLLRDSTRAEIAASVGGLDPDVVEAAALAHDLGHPPFGHITERTLDDIVRRKHKVLDGFEGNAQSFRIVTKLAVSYPDFEGLNLSRATLGAILKYPWTRGTSGKKARKWGAFSTEERELGWARALCPAGSESQSLEAALMDWADDVAYAVHDLEDFFRAGLVPLDRLATDPAERERFVSAMIARERTQSAHQIDADALTKTFHRLVDLAPMASPFSGGRRDLVALRSFTSRLVERYINAITLVAAPDPGDALVIDPIAEIEVALLKGITWHYVIDSRSLIAQRFGQSNLIKSLFTIFCEAASSPSDRHIFPALYEEALELASTDAERVRIVADLIASMTESQVIEVHHRLTGLSLGSAMDTVLP